MRILVLSWEYPPYNVGGLASHLYDLLPELVDLGVEVHLVTQGTEKTKEYEKEEGVNVHRVYTPEIEAMDFTSWVMLLNFKLLEKATSILNRKKFDLIHGHDWLVTFAAQTLKHSHTLPLVTTIHATEAGRHQGIYNREQKYINDVEWWATYESWQVICCSDYMKREVVNHFSVPDDKIKVIRNGVKEESLIEGIEDNLRGRYAHCNEDIVYYIGRLVQEKGVQFLIEAAKEILYHRPNVKFIISGEGAKGEDLKNQVFAAGLEEKVKFTGQVDFKLRNSLYNIADVAVFPSLYEPFGIVALEAMITQTPVVVSDVGGLGEIVTHNYNGLKAFPGNAHSLATNILRSLENPKLSKQLVENAYKMVKKKYNWGMIAKKTYHVYQEVIQEYKTCDWPNKLVTVN